MGAFNLVAEHVFSLERLKNAVPVPPLAAFAVGFVLYLLLAAASVQTKSLEMPHDR